MIIPCDGNRYHAEKSSGSEVRNNIEKMSDLGVGDGPKRVHC